jgi:hypothetical protein
MQSFETAGKNMKNRKNVLAKTKNQVIDMTGENPYLRNSTVPDSSNGDLGSVLPPGGSFPNLSPQKGNHIKFGEVGLGDTIVNNSPNQLQSKSNSPKFMDPFVPMILQENDVKLTSGNTYKFQRDYEANMPPLLQGLKMSL